MIIILLVIIFFFVLQSNGIISLNFYLQIMYEFIIIFWGSIFLKAAIPNLKISYTHKGVKERYKVISFYRYLKEFTLLDEKEMEENILSKDYLMYAVLFGINDNLNMYPHNEFHELIKYF